MYLDVTVCPECEKEVSPHSSKCHHCNQNISGTNYKTIFYWHWVDRFFLLSLVAIAACFFMPWFPGEFLYQDSPFSAYTMLVKLVDLKVDFLESYNVLRMVQLIPLFSIMMFFLIYLEDTLKKSPFPGIILFVILLSASLIKIFQSMSGFVSFAAATIFAVLLIYFYHKKYSAGTIGSIAYNLLLSFLSISMLVYLMDIYAAFYGRLDTITVLNTWGFWTSLILVFFMTFLLLMKNIRQAGDFWITLFIIIFSVMAYSSLLKPLFYSETFVFFADNINEISVELGAHIKIVSIALVIAITIGVPVGVYITRNPSVAGIVLYMSSILITIPSIAMFGFMMPILSSIDNAWDAVNGIGIGMVPAVVALSLYSLLPIIRNTYIALKSVDSATLEAGRGMGMTNFQLLIQLQLPLSAPIIMAGVRTAVVMAIAIAAIAAYIGAGGLGTFVSKGLQMSTNASVIAGALVMSLLAIVADLFLGKAEEWLTPEGLKIRQATD